MLVVLSYQCNEWRKFLELKESKKKFRSFSVNLVVLEWFVVKLSVT